MSQPDALRIEPLRSLDATLAVPGDKSISHRALILGALARGRSYLSNLSPAADVASTLRCLEACGASMRSNPNGRVSLDGTGGPGSLHTPDAPLDCGNSGTTMRLLAGVLAGQGVSATLDGDASLRRRPMERVAVPLREMGADVQTSEGHAPMQVSSGARLRGISYTPPVASAQLKSAVLLAGLQAEGTVRVVEAVPTRDHTERLLRRCGVDVQRVGDAVTMQPLRQLEPFGLRVPGDLSSAAFFLALAASQPGWRMRCTAVTLNPGRTGVLDALREMGAALTVEPGDLAAGVEPCGDVEVRGAGLHGIRLGGSMIPRCIDELPVLAVLATQCEGRTEIRDAAELRVKEVDRIAFVAEGLRALGAWVEELPDGMLIDGPVRLHGARLRSHGDHRLAMAWAVAAALADAPCVIEGASDVSVSYPQFFADLARAGEGVVE